MQQFLVKSIAHVKNATIYSAQGLKAAFQTELAFRIELFLVIMAFPVALFLGNTAVERAVMISTLFLVLLAELLNAAIETTLNRIALDWNPLTKKAKDMGSAAVMMTLLNVIVVWAIIIISHF